jgi:hypothetical protein
MAEDDKYRSDRLRADFYCAVDEANQDVQRLCLRSGRLLNAGNYDRLERLAEEFSKDRNVTASGMWRIEYFFDGIDDVEDYSSEKRWQDRVKQIEKWMKERPSSDTAKIAYADLMSGYALKLKKSKEEISDENEQLFKERIDTDWVTLEQVDYDARTMSWFDTALNVTWAPSFDSKTYDEVCSASRKRYPRFYAAIMNKVCYLRSDDEEKKHDSERFLEKEARRLPRGAGDEMYGLVLGWMDSGSEPNILGEREYSWTRAKGGLQLHIKKHPEALDQRAAVSSLALEVEEPELAEQAFSGSQLKR